MWRKCRAQNIDVDFMIEVNRFNTGVLYYSQINGYMYFVDNEINWYMTNIPITTPDEAKQ